MRRCRTLSRSGFALRSCLSQVSGQRLHSPLPLPTPPRVPGAMSLGEWAEMVVQCCCCCCYSPGCRGLSSYTPPSPLLFPPLKSRFEGKVAGIEPWDWGGKDTLQNQCLQCLPPPLPPSHHNPLLYSQLPTQHACNVLKTVVSSLMHSKLFFF